MSKLKETIQKSKEKYISNQNMYFEKRKDGDLNFTNVILLFHKICEEHGYPKNIFNTQDVSILKNRINTLKNNGMTLQILISHIAEIIKNWNDVRQIKLPNKKNKEFRLGLTPKLISILVYLEDFLYLLNNKGKKIEETDLRKLFE